MKLTARAADLATAHAFARHGVAPKATIDVLRATLLRTTDDGVEIIGHTLHRCHIARCAATVHIPGVAAVPAYALAALVNAMPGDATLTISYADRVVTVAAGRSRYKLPAMCASDFPTILALAAGAATIDLGEADVAALLGGPANYGKRVGSSTLWTQMISAMASSGRSSS
jgi:DNA polymerase III subunit beta